MNRAGKNICVSKNIVVYTILSNLLLTYPSVLSIVLPIPSVTVITLLYTCIFLFFLYLKRLYHYDRLLSQCFLIQLATWSILGIINHDSVYSTRIVYLINTFLAILCLWNYSDAFNKFQRVYVRFIAVLCIGGVMGFFLALFDLLPPLITYENLDGRPGEFLGVTFTNARWGNIIRYSGVFDEPGAMAAWGMMALLINRFSSYNRNFEKIIMFCLIFTLSMAYYIQLFFYIIFFKIKNLKQCFSVIMLTSSLIFCIILTKDSEYDVYTQTILRFEIDDGGNIKGNNRANAAVIAKEKFLLSPFIGNGPSITTKGEYLADNQYENLATDGIIGTMVMYLPLLVLVMTRNKNILKALFILALGYMQRPFHQNFTHAFILYLLSYTFIEYNKNLFNQKWEKIYQKLR